MPELPHRTYSGFEPAADGAELGTWTFRVAGGPAFAANLYLSLHLAAAETTVHGRRDCLERMAAAVEEASPDA